ncbi:MAG TPA: GatB/YqeY domain-containing protein [Acidobacteriota bacterium]|nr:GatB/YqeY domain-containing protein [Acidobacteriota bacterium]
MGLRDKISEDLMAAMKAKQAERLSVLRMMKAAVMNKEVEIRQKLDDAQAVQVFLGLIKQRKDSIEQFARGGRQDLVDKETAEIKVIEEYLPSAATDEEVASAVDAAIAELGAASIKDMGKVMKACMARFTGRPVDGGKVSELVKSKLS